MAENTTYWKNFTHPEFYAFGQMLECDPRGKNNFAAKIDYQKTRLNLLWSCNHSLTKLLLKKMKSSKLSWFLLRINFDRPLWKNAELICTKLWNWISVKIYQKIHVVWKNSKKWYRFVITRKLIITSQMNTRNLIWIFHNYDACFCQNSKTIAMRSNYREKIRWRFDSDTLKTRLFAVILHLS